VADVLAALTAEASSDELAGEADALAEFRRGPGAAVPGRQAVRAPRVSVVRARVAAIATAVALVLGGTVTAAYAQALPGPFQRLAHDLFGAPDGSMAGHHAGAKGWPQPPVRRHGAGAPGNPHPPGAHGNPHRNGAHGNPHPGAGNHNQGGNGQGNQGSGGGQGGQGGGSGHKHHKHHKHKGQGNQNGQGGGGNQGGHGHRGHHGGNLAIPASGMAAPALLVPTPRFAPTPALEAGQLAARTATVFTASSTPRAAQAGTP
jgi:hypothetical protein